LRWKDFVVEVSQTLVKDCVRRADGVLRTLPEIASDYPWVQQIYNVKDIACTEDGKPFRVDCKRLLSFDPIPPPELPRVKAHAVPKALGARIITKSDEYLHVLKPLQMALSKAISQLPGFGATRGQPLEELAGQLGPLRADQFYLSGDYEAATDGMNMDFSKAILEGILSEIEHEPTCAWARYEHGDHIVHYPAESGLSPVRQRVGQLMGSLLSFPILCIANDVITAYSGIDKRQINGDDLLAICTERQYSKWKETGASVGMKPSVGKNFLSRRFATFNSQLLVGGHHVPYTNLKLIMREAKESARLIRAKDRKTQVTTIVDCFTKSLQEGVSKTTLVKNNKTMLLRTPQSLDVSYKLGGLGFETTKPELTYVDKLCYMRKMFPNLRRSLPNLQVPEGYVWLTYPVRGRDEVELSPYSAGAQITEQILKKIDSDCAAQTSKEGATDIITHDELRKTHTRVVRSRILRETLQQLKLSKMVELNDGHTGYRTVCIPKSQEQSIWVSKFRDYVADINIDMMA
jgi:hypothetical protein